MAFKMTNRPFQQRSVRLTKRADKQRLEADKYVDDFSKKGERKYAKHQGKYETLSNKADIAETKEEGKMLRTQLVDHLK